MNNYNSYLHINMEHLRNNIESVLRSLTEGCSLIPVIKCNAYQLGANEFSKVIAEYDDISMIAVSHINEGVSLRQNGWKKDILVLGNPVIRYLDDAFENDLTISVGYRDLINILPRGIKVQIMFDTGLHRNGFSIDDIPDISALNVTGYYSHFADGENEVLCRKQFDDFMSLPFSGMKHICASASFENFPEYSLDAVRIGRRLHMDAPGVYDGEIREVASWRAFITNITYAHAGDSIGYGSKFILDKNCTLANISIGYGDGLSVGEAREHAPVLISGKRCPVLYSFMDQSLVDISGVKCSVGDEVTIFGYDSEGNFISSQEIASITGDDEGVGLYSMVSPRVGRIYENL